MRFAFIQAHAAEHVVTTLCRVLEVSKAGYYAWAKRGPSQHAQQDATLATAIRVVHASHQGRGRTYGSPRVHRELRAQGERHGEKRIARVMREHGIRATAVRRFRVTTQSDHPDPVAPNVLARQFRVAVPNRVWVGDMTSLRTQEGWLYLAVILDLASRRVVGWAMRHTMEQALVLDALAMAVVQRHPAPGLLHHTDRGTQYAARDYRARLTQQQMVCSMSRKGDCWDNAVAESFFATLKRELVDGADWRTRDAARTAVFQYIETWYNPHRRHSSLDYVSPMQYEQQLRLSRSAA
jgi:transposase InsO family protein